MKTLKKGFISVVLFYIIIMGLLHVFQEKLIFLPEEISQDYQYDFPFNFEEVNLVTEDQKTINALHLKAEKSKGVVLFFHGNKGNLIRWGEITSYFLQYNYDVFVIDYRGYGKSTGAFNEQLMYKDALLSYQYIKARYDENKIVVYGRSLGATFAAKVASKNNPKHVVLEAPFYNLHAAANYTYKVIPKFLLNFKFKTNEFIFEIQTPITIFHGTDDIVTPPVGSKALFQLLTTTAKAYITITNGSHHNLRDFEVYQQKIQEILE